MLASNFMSSKDTDEERSMHSKGKNIETMFNGKVEEIMEELFQSFPSRYQSDLETTIKPSEFIFDCVDLLHYKCHNINLNRGGSYADSPNLKNCNNTFRQYTFRQ